MLISTHKFFWCDRKILNYSKNLLFFSRNPIQLFKKIVNYTHIVFACIVLFWRFYLKSHFFNIFITLSRSSCHLFSFSVNMFYSFKSLQKHLMNEMVFLFENFHFHFSHAYIIFTIISECIKIVSVLSQDFNQYIIELFIYLT